MSARQSDILAVLTQIFREHFEAERLVLTEATTARDVHGWDSTAQVLLVVSVEEHFGIHFRSAELDALHCVGDWVRLISRHVAAK